MPNSDSSSPSSSPHSPPPPPPFSPPPMEAKSVTFLLRDEPSPSAESTAAQIDISELPTYSEFNITHRSTRQSWENPYYKIGVNKSEEKRSDSSPAGSIVSSSLLAQFTNSSPTQIATTQPPVFSTSSSPSSSSPPSPSIPSDIQFLSSAQKSGSWNFNNEQATTPTESRQMIIEDVVASAAVSKQMSSSVKSFANSLDSLNDCPPTPSSHINDFANSNHHHPMTTTTTSTSTTDRSQSLSDLLSAQNERGLGDAELNGSFDTLMSRGLTDSRISSGGGMARDDDRFSTDFVATPPDTFTYSPMSSFSSYEPNNSVPFINENTNPLDFSTSPNIASSPINRAHHSELDRAKPELPAITEESEHEHQNSNYLSMKEEKEDKEGEEEEEDGKCGQEERSEIVEHLYPMAHCNSAPSNAFATSLMNNNNNNNNISSGGGSGPLHRRVVSDDVSELHRLKRSKELENVDKIGTFSFETKNAKLRKGRCKSLMLVVQGSGEESPTSSEDDDIDDNDEGDFRMSKDNEMLIEKRSGDVSGRKTMSLGDREASQQTASAPAASSTMVMMSSSTEPPPVRLSRKVSGKTTPSPSSSTTTATKMMMSDQSWKSKMPPFAMPSHTMYSPQSLPSRDALSKSSYDGCGIITGGTQSVNHLESSLMSILEFTPPDKLRYEEDEDVDKLLPLSSIFRQPLSTTMTLSSNNNTLESIILKTPSPTGGGSGGGGGNSSSSSTNSSFVRRSLRKIMKRTSASASALNEQYDGASTMATASTVSSSSLSSSMLTSSSRVASSSSLKRRASAASSSLFASAQAHLKPRAKTLKKQRLGKPNKKEKTGSDTFTFGNLFRKKQPSRANLADIISDLDQRSTGKLSSSIGGVGNRRSTSASILPMSDGSCIVGGIGGRGGTQYETSSFDGLPDHISRMVSPLDGGDTCPIAMGATATASSTSSSTMFSSPGSHLLYTQLDRLWGKYDLFSGEDYQSWHEKYKHNTLSAKQVKKQDAIYELYLMEKRHCANIAFLLQGYRRRMLDENVISKSDMDILIPDVLEPLLIFHLNVLERITERMNENYEVATISDIIYEELNVTNGKHTKLCCDAYTDFGVAKEQSDILYHHLINKSTKFAEFFRRTYNEEPLYKTFDFRPLITKIIGRATKYSLLLETILKNEQPFSDNHDKTALALETARQFAHRIDENLTLAHMSRRWDEIRAQIDPSSSTSLHVPDPALPHVLITHHFDIQSLNAVPNRRLVHIGDASIKVSKYSTDNCQSSSTSSSSNGKSDKFSAIIVLFDDIILFLQRKNNRLSFIPDQGAMPVKSLLTRTSARGHSIMLIYGAVPVLFDISFPTSTDRKKWVAHLEAAPKNVPPEGVRLSQSNEEEMVRQRAERQQRSEDVWLDKLTDLFKSRYLEEEALSNYLETRLKFFDEVRQHMTQMPFKTRHDIPDRVREAVRLRFRELRRARCIPLNRLVDRMSESRDADLWSFFDDKSDAADFSGDKSSDLSDDSSSSGGGDTSSATAAMRSTKPRRIQTFHGTSQQQAVQVAIDTKNGIRRHTTVPRMNSETGSTDRTTLDDEDDDGESSRPRGESQVERKQYEEMMAKLPLRQSLKARKASTKLIKEVIALRKENHLLRSDNALTKSRCALLERSRGGSMASATASAVDESMEMLRKKEKEIREMQRVVMIERDELNEKQKAIEAQEIEIQSKWAALRQMEGLGSPQHVRSPSSSSSSMTPTTTSTTLSSPVYGRQATQASQNIEWSPALTSLATKTETKKLKK